jgi:arabinose-5-phosphate isomerase
VKNRALARAREVFDCEVEGLGRVRDSLGPSFADAVELILDVLRNDGHVIVTGVGKSLHVAEKISGILSSTGARSFVLNPVQAMHGDLGSTSGRDVLLALSFSGESDEVLRLIPAIRRHGLKVVSMTGNDKSTLAGLSDVHIAIPCGKEACPFGMAPTTSATATMVMGDALAMALLDAQKFDISDYALNHPAGAIGRALVMKAADVMRTGDRLPLVLPDATVMATLMAMTKAKSGSAIVVDEAGGLLGIFTDGDFRRVMTDGDTSAPSLLQSPISAFMTAKPQFVYDDVYAAELLKVFERRRIDDLPVCDRGGRVVGLVDIQDLPRVKVM